MKWQCGCIDWRDHTMQRSLPPYKSHGTRAVSTLSCLVEPWNQTRVARSQYAAIFLASSRITLSQSCNIVLSCHAIQPVEIAYVVWRVAVVGHCLSPPFNLYGVGNAQEQKLAISSFDNQSSPGSPVHNTAQSLIPLDPLTADWLMDKRLRLWSTSGWDFCQAVLGSCGSVCATPFARLHDW